MPSFGKLAPRAGRFWRNFLKPRYPSYPEAGHIADFILVDQSKKTLGLGAKAAYRDAVGEIRHR
jgi:hypothetical protein